MHPIANRLRFLKETQQLGLMMHIVAGYPSLPDSEAIIRAMDEADVDFIEIQIPFSDPVADGPTIMQANQQALDDGVTVQDCFHLMYTMSHQVDTPLMFMSYYNLVFNYGVDRFCADCVKAGAAGLLIPDMPPEEEKHEHLFETARKHGLANIRFASPATTPERLQKNVQGSEEGFLYCFSTFGVTGARSDLDPRLPSYLDAIRAQTRLPLAVGFGIRTHKHLEQIRPHADIAIVGSALIDAINETSQKTPAEVTQQFIANLRKEKR